MRGRIGNESYLGMRQKDLTAGGAPWLLRHKVTANRPVAVTTVHLATRYRHSRVANNVSPARTNSETDVEPGISIMTR